jgi:hypothetical protein
MDGILEEIWFCEVTRDQDSWLQNTQYIKSGTRKVGPTDTFILLIYFPNGYFNMHDTKNQFCIQFIKTDEWTI